nr:hypothetical protein [uncultured Methanobacterium sp.]
MKNSVNKPWENIPITDIQPYPSNYTKIVITSYIFTAVYLIFNIICNINISNNGLNLLMLLIISQILVYGVFAFTLLYFYAQCNRNLMISEFLTATKIITACLIGSFIIITLINRVLTNSGDINLIHELLNMITLLFYLLFFIIAFVYGPVSLLGMDHPKATIHGILTTVPTAAIFLVYGVYSLTLL